MSANKLAIARDTVLFSLSSFFSQGVSFFLAIFIRNTLGPEAMGVWALLQVVLSYITYTNLGVMSAVCREIPVLRGQKADETQIRNLRDAGYSYLSIVAVATCIGLSTAAFLLRGRISQVLVWGLVVAALMTMLERFVAYSVQVLYTEKKFALVSSFRAYSAVVNAFLVLALSWKWKLYGFYAATVLSFVFDWSYLKLRSGLTFHRTWRGAETWRLIRVGVPITALAFATTFFNSMDRVSIGKFLGLRELGVYTLALMAGRYVFLLPNMFQVVLLPTTLEKFGDADDAGRRKYSTLPGRLMVLYFSLFLGFIWIASPFFCRLLLPKYVGGLPALRFLIYAYAFMALSQQMGHVLFGYRRHLWMIPVALVFAGAFWLACRSLSPNGGITAIAAAMAAFQLVYYVIGSWFGLSKIYAPREIAAHIGFNVLPFAASFAAVLALDRLYPGDTLLAVAVKCAVYAAAWIGLMAWLERETGVFKILKETFASWKLSRRTA